MILTPEQYPGLPKWPATFITGKSVTVEQAKEIIFRTDTSVRRAGNWSIGGNDRRFKAHLEKLFGWDALEALHTEFDRVSKEYREAEQVPLFNPLADMKSPWDIGSEWAEKMGMISTEYISNSFLSSAYIGGPHGWCNPDGRIHFENHNIGKWPSVEEVVKDWETLVAAFPYLDLVCTLYNAESSEDHGVPVCSIIVKDGKVEVHSPDVSLHGHEPNHRFEMNMGAIMALSHGNYRGEQGWPTGWAEEFAVKSKAVMAELLAE